MSSVSDDLGTEYQNWRDLTDRGDELLKSFEEEKDEAILLEAIECFEKARSMSSRKVGDMIYTLRCVARARFIRFVYKEDIADLDACIAHRYSVFEWAQSGHPDLSTTLHELAGALLIRFKQTEDLSDVDMAITHLESAHQLIPPGSLQLAVVLGALSHALLTRFEYTADSVDLMKAVGHHVSVGEQISVGDLSSLNTLNNIVRASNIRMEGVTANLTTIFDRAIKTVTGRVRLGLASSNESDAEYEDWNALVDRGEAFLWQSEVDGVKEALHEAVECFKSAATICTRGVGDAIYTLGSLSNALLARFERTGDLADLEDALVNVQKTLELAPLGHPEHSGSLISLAGVLLTRFEEVGNRADLDASIIHYQSALELAPVGHPDHSDSLTNVANVLLTRFEQDGNRADLDAALVHYQSVLELTLPNHPDRSIILTNLSAALLARYRQVGELTDLNEAIACAQSAQELRTHNHPLRSSTLDTLATALITRFERIGDRADLDAAIYHHQRALELTSHCQPGRSVTLHNLASVLLTRFHHDGSRTDLDEAIIHHRRALELTPLGHPDRSSSLGSLGTVLLTCFQKFGDYATLNKAIIYQQSALELTPASHPDRYINLNNLANVLFTRFQHVGERADLDDAIVQSRNGLGLTPLVHPNRPASLTNLIAVLHTRFELIGDHADLQEIILYSQSALKLTPPGHPGRALTLNNLAIVLLTRFQHVGDRADLEEAIVHHQSALELRSPGHLDHFYSLSNLASVFLTRFEEIGDQVDLDEAIAYAQTALEVIPHSHPDRSHILNHLANALHYRFRQLGDHADLDQAIAHHQSALELAPTGHPQHSERCIALANDLRMKLANSTSDLENGQSRIFNLLREATLATSGSSINSRLRASLSWVHLTVEWSDPSALDAYRVALELLETLLAMGRSLESRHLRLTSTEAHLTRNLATDGAACAIASNQLELAIEILEQGRSVLFTQAGKYRTPIDDLEIAHPALATEFRQLSVKMEMSVMTLDHLDSDYAHPTGDAVAIYQKLLEQWSNAIQKIRSLPDFSSFLQPTPFDVLKKAATGGPVIILIVNESLAVAIIIRIEADPYAVYLTDAKLEEIAGMNKMAISGATTSDFLFLLRRLWEIIVKPITHVLQNDLQLPKGSRIWWCPTGATSHLPLHAAGEYVTGGSSLPNIYISSYTTTLNSLIKARELAARHSTRSAGLLVVGQADVSGLAPLESVQHEIDCIRDLFPSATVLEGMNTTREAVMSSMAEHEWLHLSCHGYVNQKEPFKSHFSIMDGPLTLSEIAKRGLPKADIAFLSACHSAAGNRDRSDEALHLVAGLQFAGYRSVVGTLWEMADFTGPIAAKEFWSTIQKLQMEGKDGAAMSAKALHRAVNALRRASPKVDIVDWACFVHYGC